MKIWLLAILGLVIVSCEKSSSSRSSGSKSDNDTKFKDSTQIIITELLLIDSVFTHKNDTTDSKFMGFSMFYPSDTLPANWATPVNYKDGDLYYRVSVLSKADNRLVNYQVGFQWYSGCNGNIYKEKFSSSYNIQFTTTGVYDTVQSVPDFWEPDCQVSDPIQWTLPDKILVVLRDEHHQVLDDRWGYGGGVSNLYSYYPIEVHLQLVLVAKKDTFSGWGNYPILEP